jgi:arabinose-5-phosphate isomerase
MPGQTPSELVRIEAAGLLALADRLDGPMAQAFERAVSLVTECGGANGRALW